MVNTIGPHWDGNEVWLLTAGGAMFAAFAGWYATLFSSLYRPLFLVLVGLILRGVAFEFRSHADTPAGRKAWDVAACVGSLLPPLVLGVGFGNFVRGIVLVGAAAPTAIAPYRVGATGVVPFYDGFVTLFHPYCLIGGGLFVALCLAHGAHFAALKTVGAVRGRARAAAGFLAPIALALALAFVIWGNLGFGRTGTGAGKLYGLLVVAWIAGGLACVGLAAAIYANRTGREGLAFLATAVAWLGLVAMVFAHMFPNLGFDTTVGQLLYGWSEPQPLVLEMANSTTTLTLMTWVAAFLVPVVLAYTVWSYVTFSHRLSTRNMG
jgi:cytochrome d ubiquinol oxidase subunit II